MLISLKCCISFTDTTRKETFNDIKGRTAFFWIINNIPGIE